LSFNFFQLGAGFFIEIDGIVGEVKHSQWFHSFPILNNNIENVLIYLIIREVYITYPLQKFSHLLKATSSKSIGT
jgi:hypothetical protein